MPKQILTADQLKAWQIASNRVSLESIRYAAEIVGYTKLATATSAMLESLIENRASPADCCALYLRATRATFGDEPLLDSILIALKWACSDGTGEFMVGNIVDPIHHYIQIHESRDPDAETYKRLREIHSEILEPYYRQLYGVESSE